MRKNSLNTPSPWGDRGGKTLFLAVATLGALLAVLPVLARYDEVEASRTVEEVLRFTGASPDDPSFVPLRGNLLLVDNVFGSIEVSGWDGDEVRLTAREVIRARSERDLERARGEAGLAIETGDGEIRLVVDGPFRREDGSLQWDHDLGYEIVVDFEIRVPRRTRLVLRNINEGDVRVQGVAGDFEVSNVNGAIAMRAVAGHGRVHTVNGGIDASFVESPSGACDFKTVNGSVDVAFPDDFAADLRFKTMNGDVYTEFPWEPRAVERPRAQQHGRRTVWKSLGYGAAIAGGGPELSFETLNGDITIRNADR